MDKIINKINGKIAFWEGVIIGQNIILKNAASGTARYESAQQLKQIAENEIMWCKLLIKEIENGV
jgi:hypothetical protein